MEKFRLEETLKILSLHPPGLKAINTSEVDLCFLKTPAGNSHSLRELPEADMGHTLHTQAWMRSCSLPALIISGTEQEDRPGFAGKFQGDAHERN